MAGMMKRISQKIIVPPGCQEQFLEFWREREEALLRLGVVLGGVSRVVAPYHIVRPARSHAMIAFTLAGQGAYRDREGMHLIEPDTVWVQSYDLPQEYWTEHEWSYVWFHVKPVAAETGLLSLPNTGGAPRLSRCGHALQTLAELYHRECAIDDEFAQQLKRTHAEAMALYLRRELGWMDSGRGMEYRVRLHNLWQDVACDCRHPWSLGELAACFHLSVPQFRRVVIKHEGVPPMKKVTQLRMQEGRRLLRSTALSLDRIAEMLGYSTAYAFSKAFTRTVDCRPGQYRRKRRQHG